MGLLTRLRGWWGSRSAPAALPYEVTCPCGQVATGLRMPEAQVIRCSRCGEELFVLPLSRLPEVTASGDGPALSPAPRSGLRRRPWWLPALAAGLTLLLLLAAYVVFFAPFSRQRDGNPPFGAEGGQGQAGPERFADRLTAARRQLGQGNFRLALEELQAARALCESDPRLCGRAQRLELAQLRRQAGLLVDLLSESLGEVVQHAAGVQEREWQADFPHRYQGRALVLDLELRPGLGGRLDYDLLLPVRGELAQAELNDLALLRRLPLEQPQRVVFGVRLASVRREPGRSWVVRFEPDSAVLLTDPEAAVACFLSPDDPEVRALLQRQTEWTAREPLSATVD
ncbi:MAG: hypothetical protein L0Z62_32005 [Gemmataceae bacterium]|nr:hypothetical protein [Gemmataceae bacterium]